MLAIQGMPLHQTTSGASHRSSHDCSYSTNCTLLSNPDIITWPVETVRQRAIPSFIFPRARVHRCQRRVVCRSPRHPSALSWRPCWRTVRAPTWTSRYSLVLQQIWRQAIVCSPCVCPSGFTGLWGGRLHV